MPEIDISQIGPDRGGGGGGARARLDDPESSAFAIGHNYASVTPDECRVSLEGDLGTAVGQLSNRDKRRHQIWCIYGVPETNWASVFADSDQIACLGRHCFHVLAPEPNRDWGYVPEALKGLQLWTHVPGAPRVQNIASVAFLGRQS